MKHEQTALQAIIELPDKSGKDEKFDPTKLEILGLTVLERTLWTLDRAGVKQVHILPNGNRESLKTILSKERNWDLQIMTHNGQTRDELLEAISPDDLVFSLSEPLVMEASVPVTMLTEVLSETNTVISAKNKKILVGQSRFFKTKSTVESREIDLPFFCFAIKTAEDVKSVTNALIGSLTKPTDGWVSRTLNRHISTAISRVLAKTSVTPNQVTVVNGLVGFIPCYFMYEGGYWNWLIGTGILHLTSVVDGVDGEIARLKYKSSKFGQSLDTFFDYTTAVAALACLIFGVRNAGWPEMFYQIGLSSILFTILALLVLVLYVIRFKGEGAFFNIGYGFRGKTSRFASFMEFLGLFTKREWYNLIFFVMAIVGLLPWALVYVAIMTFLVFIFAVRAHFINRKA